ncbi:hypothetical protein KEM56_006939 [Ascosphaera pollenicola]|nr:hypothetical protein KEM56_006939 [Ascosphaera pollenicola]
MDPVVTAGRKRLASEALDGEQQRLNKKFNQLHIGRQLTQFHDAGRITPPESVEGAEGDISSDNYDEFMDVGDTKHRVYVSNLEHEIRKIEREEKQKEDILLPGLEKLMYNPKSLYVKPPEPPGNQLVLYRVPASISIPEHHDSVKRALSDARDRASAQLLESGRKQRESNVVQNNEEQGREDGALPSTEIADKDEPMEPSDDDAMDIDEEF